MLAQLQSTHFGIYIRKFISGICKLSEILSITRVMNVYRRNFKTLREELKWTLYSAICAIVLIEFVFVDIPEVFPKASTIGSVILKLSYSYISALLFYYLVVHFKRQDEKRKYYKILNHNLSVLINQGGNIYSSIKSITGNEDFERTDENQLKLVLKKIDPNQKFIGTTYGNSGEVDWRHHLLFQSEKGRREIDFIFKNSVLLDAELLVLLNELYKNSLFDQLIMFSSVIDKLDDESFEFYSGYFKDYYIKLDKIKKYKEKEVDKYLN